jgi:hypothetical protein
LLNLPDFTLGLGLGQIRTQLGCLLGVQGGGRITDIDGECVSGVIFGDVVGVAHVQAFGATAHGADQ